MINYNFKIELSAQRTLYTDIVFTSGDVKGYRLNFAFYDGKKQQSLSGCTLTVKAKRPDGSVICDVGTVQENEAYYVVKSSMISVPGEVSFELALADESGMYVTAKELIANVREGYGDGDITAKDTAPVLSALLSAASAAQLSANASAEAAEAASAKADEALAEASLKVNQTAYDTQLTELTEKLSLKADKTETATYGYVDEKISGIPVITVDDALSETSENPVQNKAVMAFKIANEIRLDALETSFGTYTTETDDKIYTMNMGISEIEMRQHALQDQVNTIVSDPNSYNLANKAYVDSAIGDIETALDNIIVKYGLGGETA